MEQLINKMRNLAESGNIQYKVEVALVGGHFTQITVPADTMSQAEEKAQQVLSIQGYAVEYIASATKISNK